MRSILTVVGLSLFFIVAISGVLIAQKQRQTKEAVAPTAPVSRPSAAEPAASNACQKTFDVAFTPGNPISSTYACNADCTSDSQCSAVDSKQICYRPTPGVGADAWTVWLDSSEAVSASVGSGQATSFDAFIQPDGSIKQYVVKGGKLYVRIGTVDATTNTVTNWTAWDGPNPALSGATGAGTLTSFAAFALPNDPSTVRQHAVKGGQIWYRDGINNADWTAWADVTSNITGDSSAGTGTITSFASYVMSNNSVKQYLVRGGTLYVGTSTPGSWVANTATYVNTSTPGSWVANTATNGFGSGDFTSFSAYIQPDGSTMQFFIKGGSLTKRDNAGGKCRVSTIPEAVNCKETVLPGVASCTSKTAATIAGVAIAPTTPLKKGQEFIYKITVTGSTPAAQNVIVTDTLPASLSFVGPLNDPLVKYDETTRKVSATYLTVDSTPKILEFTVKVSATAAFGSDIKNTATVTTDAGNPSTCGIVTHKVETENPTYACNSACTSNAQCQTVNNDYICDPDQGNRCRLDTNRGSATCTAPPKTYTCNATCDTDENCKSYNVSYKCFPAGGTTGKVCRLATNETSVSCNNPSSPPPVAAIGCNQTCVTNADCSNSTQICYDTALVGQTAGKVCRLANYVNSSTCNSPTGTTVAQTPPTTTTGGQPALPAELPQTGPEEWLNWLKAGLITLGVGAALLLLL